MKGDSLDKCRHQEWERLLKDNNIYLGDHMTRVWDRNDKEEGNGDERRKSTIKSDKTNDEVDLKQYGPTARCSKRKLTPGKQKLKAGKEYLTRHNITKKDIKQWQESFDALLNSSTGCYLFKLFLESEIADENLKFWLACEDLKNSKQKKLDKRIQDIYDTYINVYSPHEINIDYKMREEIVDQLKCKAELDVSVFSEAQHQVYTLMHRDSYPRFLTSPLAMELIDALSAEHEQDDETKLSKKDKEDSLSISGLVLCCYLRRWNIDRDNSADDEPTAITQVGTSELIDESNHQCPGCLNENKVTKDDVVQVSNILPHSIGENLEER